MSLSARDRLNVNISTTFVELAIATVNLIGKEDIQASKATRGSSAPYRIVNRTGLTMLLWSDLDGSTATVDTGSKELVHGKSVDWRFDDWRTMREVIPDS